MSEYNGKSIANFGVVRGEALVSKELIAFWGGMSWETGEIVEIGHRLKGVHVNGKILVFQAGKGGAGDTFGYYYLARNGKAPVALICNRGQGTTIAGALLAETPMIYDFGCDITEQIKNGDIVEVDSEKGTITIIERIE